MRPYDVSANPLKVVRNVSTYALWPIRWTHRGYLYLWACGHEDTMPHVCPKGPNRGTLFQAPDLRNVRPGWKLAARFMDRHSITPEWDAEAARTFAMNRVRPRKVA